MMIATSLLMHALLHSWIEVLVNLVRLAQLFHVAPSSTYATRMPPQSRASIGADTLAAVLAGYVMHVCNAAPCPGKGLEKLSNCKRESLH